METAIAHIAESVVISNHDGEITYVNRAFEQLSGYGAAEVVGNTLHMLQRGEEAPDLFAAMHAALLSGSRWSGLLVIHHKDGTKYEAMASIAPIHDAEGDVRSVVSVHRDVTRERERERAQQRSHRLEAIGTLAGGIAHDFNNILTPIMGYADVVVTDLPAGSPLRDDLEQVQAAAVRAKDLVRRILAFSRHSPTNRGALVMGPVVAEALKFLRASTPTTIEFRVEIVAADVAVFADPTEVHQIVMNLGTNAAHAMRDGGVLEVSLVAEDVDDDLASTLGDVAPGKFLRLTVRDSGGGMTPEVRTKIFEPYFTTKPFGEGSGLGLAITQSIVVACGGAIRASSELGQGTVFDVYFPVSSGAVAPIASRRATEGAGRGESILFVDDDRSIAKLSKRILERYGYVATSLTDPRAALQLVQDDPHAFALVVTDMTMPTLTGDVLAESILALRPDIPIIVCTGFSERLTAEHAAKIGIRQVLNKPVPPARLIEVIGQLLHVDDKPPGDSEPA